MVDSASERSLYPYSPRTTEFSEAARERIRRLIRAATGTTHDRLTEEIQSAAAFCARDARKAGARAEQFLVALKREWSTAADSGGVGRQHAMEIATRLVSAAIIEFYRAE